MIENNDAALVSGKDRPAWRVGLDLAVAVALSCIVGLGVLGIPAVLGIFSIMGKEGLTIDELKALDMVNGLNGPLEPVGLNALGWIAIFAPLGLLLWFGTMRQDRGDAPSAKDYAIFGAIAALMGIACALLFRFSDAVACAGFVIVAIAVAAWQHADFVEQNFSRARNALLAALFCALSGGLGYGSWLMAAVPIIVFGVIGFAVLLVRDLRRLRPDPSVARGDPLSDSMLAALSLYLSLSGVAASLAALAG
jgi:hypothetical protein